MNIPKDVLNHIKEKVLNLKKGEIEVDINETKDKMDVVVKNSIKTTSETIIEDMERVSRNIHHGKIRIGFENDVNSGPSLKINVEERERFKKNGK